MKIENLSNSTDAIAKFRYKGDRGNPLNAQVGLKLS
ncbi:hypothetical protein L8106_24830 [Lyngbya sp. PCC 8106]|nr:hypothetical protein L8106_24830 [Lyngbya sp. PCC 8106]